MTMKKIGAKIVLALVVAAATSAYADVFKLYDYMSDEQVTLTVNGITVTGNGPIPGSGWTVNNWNYNPNFVWPQNANVIGERLTFDLTGYASQPGSVYTKLTGGPEEYPFSVSDEFRLWSAADGVFHVDFISADNYDGVMPYYYGSLTPSILSGPEVGDMQPVGYLNWVSGAPGGDAFYAMSIPEPGTCAMILVGLGLFGLIRRKH